MASKALHFPALLSLSALIRNERALFTRDGMKRKEVMSKEILAFLREKTNDYELNKIMHGENLVPGTQ